jgi:rhodanese-related sulfurtransferase
MKRSRLVQRLQRPRSGGILGPDNPFAFGGGLRNGGLSDDAMGLLRSIFTFDYMGAAEFEFGAVPEALQALAADARELVAFGVAVPLATVPPNWRDKSKDVPSGDAHIYVLCRHGQSNEVTARVQTWATESLNDLKEQTRLASALRPFNEWDTETAGWLEISNGFFFFTDRDMWAKTCDLFGVAVSA